MTEATTPMPRYRCHKEVWALQIKDVTGCTITPVGEDYAPFDVDPSMYLRYTPVAGDYYVVYEDGYKSFSPKKAFEEGYRLIIQRPARIPTVEELEKILNGPELDVRIEADGTVTQGFAAPQIVHTHPVEKMAR